MTPTSGVDASSTPPWSSRSTPSPAVLGHRAAGTIAERPRRQARNVGRVFESCDHGDSTASQPRSRVKPRRRHHAEPPRQSRCPPRLHLGLLKLTRHLTGDVAAATPSSITQPSPGTTFVNRHHPIHCHGRPERGIPVTTPPTPRAHPFRTAQSPRRCTGVQLCLASVPRHRPSTKPIATTRVCCSTTRPEGMEPEDGRPRPWETRTTTSLTSQILCLQRC